MMVLVDFPCIVKQYAPHFESCFSAAGYQYFQKALSGFLLSENKTLEAINRLFVLSPRHQSSFNRFFKRQNFDIDEVHRRRLALLQQQEGTRFKADGALSIDNTLLKHWGRQFENIYRHKDYVLNTYCWAHDLVNLNYNDEQTDYPLDYCLWEPPDWEAVARFFMEREFKINPRHWQQRQAQERKWRNYIRDRYKSGWKKFPEVLNIYKTKIHLGEDLLRRFCQQHPELNLPVLLDNGFTSAHLCAVIDEDLQRAYVGQVRDDQCLIRAGGQKQSLAAFIQQLRQEQDRQPDKSPVRKTGFRYRKRKYQCYTYVGNHRLQGFAKKQRLVISFNHKDLTDRPHLSITNRLNWSASCLLRLRRLRWPIETYHQEAKAEGLDKYQVRNLKAILTHIALVVVAYSMLKCAVQDEELLRRIQQRLQTETEGTLPFLRRLMQAESLLLLVQYIFLMSNQGQELHHVVRDLVGNIAYA